MTDFKPLDAQRAIRDDTELRATEKALLWSAVLRTDNTTRKVRASMTTLAKDAGLHRNTATAIFAETNTPVIRYFEKVERQTRRIDLWFHPSDRLAARAMHSECASRAGDDDEADAQSVCKPCTVSVQAMHSECAPSALSASTSANTSANTFTRPSSIQGDEPTQNTETAAGSISDRPVSAVIEAVADEEDIETLPCGCFAGLSCPECRGDAPKQSKHSPEKLKQMHDQRNVRDEGIRSDGTPLDPEKGSSGYRARRGS